MQRGILLRVARRCHPDARIAMLRDLPLGLKVWAIHSVAVSSVIVELERAGLTAIAELEVGEVLEGVELRRPQRVRFTIDV